MRNGQYQKDSFFLFFILHLSFFYDGHTLSQCYCGITDSIITRVHGRRRIVETQVQVYCFLIKCSLFNEILLGPSRRSKHFIYIIDSHRQVWHDSYRATKLDESIKYSPYTIETKSNFVSITIRLLFVRSYVHGVTNTIIHTQRMTPQVPVCDHRNIS